MTGDDVSPHEFWDQQAAAYALDALDVDERDEFAAHLADCARCRDSVDQHALTAAQLGALAADDRPAPPWSALRAGIVETDVATQPSRRVVPLRRRHAPTYVWAAAAAAAVVVGAVVYTNVGSAGRNEPLASAAACARTTGCHQVTLTAAGADLASVLVYRNTAAVVSATMPTAPSGSAWALWQVPKTGAPQLLTTFSSPKRAHAALASAYGDTAAFAISREPAGTTPTKPSQIVATGTVA